MSLWITRGLTSGVVLFVVGLFLVLVSGHEGGSTGGSEFVWRLGGVLVYVALPTLVISGLAGLVISLRRRR